jgi:nitroreductase
MDILKAIYQRRAVRDYTDQDVSRDLVGKLIDAAIQAPTALDGQLLAFAVIQGRQRLRDYSDRAKAHFLQTFSPGRDPHSAHHDILKEPSYNIFYNAGTVVAVYSRPGGQFNTIDCCLAAENLMLAALAMGLGSCPIGFAQAWLDHSETKEELGIPGEYTAVLPIILGYPAGPTAPVPRKAPEIHYCP